MSKTRQVTPRVVSSAHKVKAAALVTAGCQHGSRNSARVSRLHTRIPTMADTQCPVALSHQGPWLAGGSPPKGSAVAAPLLTLTAPLVGSSKYYSCKCRSHNGNSACHQPWQTDFSTGVYVRVLDKFTGKMGSERASSPRGTSRQRCEWTLRV